MKEGKKIQRTQKINFIKNKKFKIITITAIVFIVAICIFLNSETIKKTNFIQDIRNRITSMLNQPKITNLADEITNIDLTGLVTGGDVNHTHIYEKKYDNNYHWEECFICGDVINKENHHKETTGSGICETYMVERCTDGCGYSVSTFIDHEIMYYEEGNYVQNPATYVHYIGECAKCGAQTVITADGEKTIRECIDDEGNPIDCRNLKQCVGCGYDFSALTEFCHHSNTLDSDGQTYLCENCGIPVYKVLHQEEIQDSENNLHWTMRGIYQLLGDATWAKTYGLATWSPLLDSGEALESLTPAHVIELPSEYYNKPEYGTEGINSGLYLVEYEAYLKDGFQGTVNVRMNADYCFKNINGNPNEFGKTYAIVTYISPDTKEPSITNTQINRPEIINGYSQKATLTVDCYDSYSDIASIGLYDLEGNCIQEYGAATSNGDKTFTRSFDIVAEIREAQTLVVKAKDRYGNETSQNIEIQNLDAKAPTLINNEDYTSQWSKNKQITFTAEDQGIGNVQIAFNTADDYKIAQKDNEHYTRTYNFYGDVYDKVTAAIYLKDELGNEQMVKVDIGRLDNTAPSITNTVIENNKIIITANDLHETLGEGSGVIGYRYIASNEETKEIGEGEGTYIGTNEINLTDAKNVKYVYIAPIDQVGNIGETKRVELPTYSYTVNYYQKGGTNKVAESKIVEGKLLGEKVIEEAIEIEGYNKIEPTSQTIEIGLTDNIINFYYDKTVQLVVHHYIEGTETPVPLKDGQPAEDETYIGIEGTEYYVEPINDEELSNKYELSMTNFPDNDYGTYEGEEITVTFYYKKAKRTYIIRNNDAENGNPIEGAEFTIQTKEGDLVGVYTTNADGEIEIELEVGEYIVTQTDVPEMYVLPEDGQEFSIEKRYPSTTTSWINERVEPVVNSTITMDASTEEITIGEAIEYTIHYQATVEDYKGNATVTIVDQLPYEIDESKANTIAESGGVYNPENKTITWTETIENIDTFTGGDKVINITKKISFVYKDIDVISNIQNEAVGKISIGTETIEEIESNVAIVTTPVEYLVDIRVTKVWEDEEDVAQKRPESVYLVIKEGVVTKGRELVNAENNWTCVFEDLPKYDIAGDEINYTITEEEVNTDDLKFYAEGVQAGSIDQGFTLTNQFAVPDETVNVTVTKKWEDTAEQQDKRPATVAVKVVGTMETEGDVVHQYDVKVNEGWTYTFTDLPKYDINGDEIVYSVIEEEVNDFYQLKEVTGDQEIGFTITNEFVRPEDTIDVTVKKEWEDTQEQQDKRPEEVTVNLIGTLTTENDTVKTEIIKAEEGWTKTFTGLPKYNSNGDEIVYTVTEEKVNDFYQLKEVTGNQTTGFTIKNEFKRPDDTIDVTVTKAWEDEVDQQDKRPPEVTVSLIGSMLAEDDTIKTEIIKAEEGWTKTFTDLPKYDSNGNEIAYKVVEEGNYEFYVLKGITGDTKTGFTITNQFALPGDTIEITVNKEWEDTQEQQDKRPEEVSVTLTGTSQTENDIVRTESIKAEEGWTKTFTGLPKYNKDGNEIVYTVTEEINDFYQLKDVIGDQINGFTIINEFRRPEDTIEITVSKKWEDTAEQQDKRPEEVTVNLIGTLLTTNDTKKTETIKASEGWTKTFTGLPKYDVNGDEIVYTVTEEKVNDFYQLREVTGDQANGFTITNQFILPDDTVNIKVTKAWEDTADQQDKRPEEITAVITGSINTPGDITREAQIKKSENWTYTFEGLPKYNSDGNIINYTVTEIGEYQFYQLKDVTKNSENEYTITNEFVRPEDTIEVTVHKKWVDKDDIYEKRPDYLILKIINPKTQEETKSEPISITGEDSYTFTNLAKYDENGDEIAYTADEQEVSSGDLFNYGKEVSPITNIEGETDKKEITITNTIEKIPAEVIVRYVDINDPEETEIATPVVKEGIVGEGYDVSEDKKEIPGYTLVQEPEEKTGTYTEEEQEKIYYYAKNTRVITKYLEQGTDIVLSEQPEYVQEGYVGKFYMTAPQDIEGYTYVADTNNLSGSMTEETITVIYYYAKNTKITVKYLEQGTNKVLTEQPEYVQEGYVGKEYSTEQKEIEGYTFVTVEGEVTGSMTEEAKTITYYYAKNTKITVKYLEQGTNKILTEQPEYVQEGYVGKYYETEQKKIEGYTYVRVEGEAKGTMTEEAKTITYYYAKNTKVTVLHIDKNTNEILETETKEGKVGDNYTTESKNFEGYVLVEAPEEPNGTMTEKEIILRYYYVHKSAGVIERHIDIITGAQIVEAIHHEGNENDYYHILPKTFENYDLVEQDKEGNNMLPENAEGNMKKNEVIEVTYYYHRKANVKVEYIDKLTGEKLTEDIFIQGHQNDPYETEAKEFKNYVLEKMPDNYKGNMEVTRNEDGTYNTETIVQYYYIPVAGGVKEEHIDINSNKILVEGTHGGKIGDEYEIPPRDIEGYKLVEQDEEGNNMLPENAKGSMTEESITVKYYYVKEAKVIVEYVDKLTGKELHKEEITGYEGDPYKTEAKEFDGYDLIEEPKNKEGEMEDKDITVTYYYAKKTEIEVQYLEKGTNNPLVENESMQGHVGEEYETEPKEIPYYKFVESTNNTEGTMTEEKIIVIYYYEKQVFNLKVDKWVDNVTMNGIPQGGESLATKDELFKVEMHRSKVETANISIKYKIRISNVGEIEGTVNTLTEVIPNGYSFYQEDNSIVWEDNKGILTTSELQDETIQPGEYKEIEIVLRWNKGADNFGEKDNLVVLSNISNPAGYEDIYKEDNSSRDKMIVAISTGLDRNDKIVVIGTIQIVLAIAVGLLVSYKKKKK